MKRRISLLFLTLCLFIFRPNIAIAEVTPTVFFSEVAWAGSSISPYDEWIELKNNTNYDIDLTGWQITNLNSSNQETVMITLSGTIIVNGFFLISNNSATHNFSKGQSVLNITPDYINSQVSLSNERLQLKLYNESFSNGNLIDIAGNGSAPPAGSNNLHQSMSRKIPLMDGNLSTSWYSSNQSSNFDQGVSDFGTPRAANKSQPLLNGNCSPQLIPKAKNSHIACSGEISDYNGEEVEGNINLLNNIYPLDITIGWQWQQDINPQNNDSIELLITATNKSGLSTVYSIIVQTYSLSNKIIINEIFPAPSASSGNEEWVELFNEGQEDIDLYLWQLDDIINGGSKPYTFPIGSIIKANDYLIMNKSQTKIALNNDNDDVNLIDPENNIVSSTSYSNVDYDYSWTRLNERSFVETPTITKDSANIFPENKNYYGAIIISEVLPDPEGSDEEGEWIEIQSQVDYPIDLYNWKIDDENGGSSPYEINDHIILEPFEYISFDRKITNIAFNNNEDSAYIYSSDESVVNYIDYKNANSNFSYAYFDSGYEWTNNQTKNNTNKKSIQVLESSPTQSPQTTNVENTATQNVEKKVTLVEVKPVSKITLLPILEKIDFNPINNFINGKVLGISDNNETVNQSKWLFLGIFFVIIVAILNPNYHLWKLLKTSIKPKNSRKDWHPG